MKNHFDSTAETLFTKITSERSQPIGSDQFTTESPYSRSPINNFKWTKVGNVLGPGWIDGKHTIEEFEDGSLISYEWAKGNIPKSHILQWVGGVWLIAAVC